MLGQSITQAEMSLNLLLSREEWITWLTLERICLVYIYIDSPVKLNDGCMIQKHNSNVKIQNQALVPYKKGKV